MSPTFEAVGYMAEKPVPDVKMNDDYQVVLAAIMGVSSQLARSLSLEVVLD